MFTVAFASGMIPKTLVPTPGISEEGEEIDLDPEQLAKTAQKRTEHVTCSRRVNAKSYCDKRDVDSESFRTGSTCQHGGNCNNSFSPMNLSWMETVLLYYAENAQSQEILKVLDYWQSSPIMPRL